MFLDDFLAQVEARKAELGMQNSSEQTEALRNKGDNRTPAKRALLRNIEKRAKAVGLTPIAAYY